MALSRRTGRSRLTLGLLVLTSITVLTLDFRDAPVISGVRSALGTAFEPVRGAAESAFDPVADAWRGVTGYGELEEENARLRARIEELEGAEAIERDATAQLDELLALAEIEWAGDLERIQARVVSRPPSNFDRTIDIGKGTSSGVEVGMPVVTGGGLVGMVVDATPSRASVRLISDPDSRVGVRVSETGALGTLEGRGRSDEVVVDTGLAADEEVAPGTLLMTSGTDHSRFPAGLPVARVMSTRPASNDLNLELVAEPLVDPDSLSYVAVLVWTAP